MNHADGLNHLLGEGAIVSVRGNFRDGVHHFHTLDHAAKCSVLTVQIGGIPMNDKELRGCAVIAAGTRHGNHAAHVGNVVGHAVNGKLTLDIRIRAAHTGSLGVTALDHKALDDTVEDQSVVKALGNKLLEVLGIGLDGNDLGKLGEIRDSLPDGISVVCACIYNTFKRIAI